MATIHIYLNDLHFDHKLWLNKLRFYKEELGLYNGYLAEVAARWTDSSVKATLEQFQNQFHIQNNEMDTLMHEIKLHEEELTEFAKKHEVAIDHIHFDKEIQHHKEMEERVGVFEKLYTELKENFKHFLTKYL